MLNNFVKFLVVLSVSVSFLYSSNLDKLLDVSGITYSIKQVPLSMASATDKSLSGQKKELVTEYNRAVTESFDIANIISNVKIYLNDNLSTNSIKTSLVWFESDLGKQIKTLMITKPKNITQDEIKDLKANKKRFNLIKKIDHNIHASQSGIQISLTTQRSMMDSMMAMMPQSMKIPQDEIDRMIEEGKGHVIQSVTNQVLALLLVNLQPISTDELNKYLKFAKSDLGQEFYVKSNDAVEISIKRASESFGTRMGEIAIKNSGIK